MLKKVLNDINDTLYRVMPRTMDELIEVVHKVPGAGKYGTHFRVVMYKGYVQGVRVYVTGRKNSYPLPNKYKVYSVFHGLESYIKAGQVEHEND